MWWLLFACESDGSIELLSGFDFGWRAFNHRLSAMQVGVDGQVAVVGGTSTTGVVPEYAEGCDPEACQEFPFVDTADIALRTSVATASGLRATTEEISLSVGSAGATGLVSFGGALGEGWQPAIASLSLRTTGESSCYNPDFGWLFRRFGVAVDKAGDQAEVSAVFEAGYSLEDERECLDAAIGGAGLEITVGAVAIEGVELENATFEQSASWGGSDGEWESQVPPAAEAIDLPENRAWQAMEWWFHEEDPQLRGAYLRTMGVDANGRGWATNESPGTQLSGFEYRFVGGLVAFEGEGESVERTAAYAPVLDENGAAVGVLGE